MHSIVPHKDVLESGPLGRTQDPMQREVFDMLCNGTGEALRMLLRIDVDCDEAVCHAYRVACPVLYEGASRCFRRTSAMMTARSIMCHAAVGGERR